MNCYDDFLSIEDAHFDYFLTSNCTHSESDLKLDLICNLDAWPIVNAMCGSTTSCTFEVNSELFGNACDDLNKKLVITYTCLKGECILSKGKSPSTK